MLNSLYSVRTSPLPWPSSYCRSTAAQYFLNFPSFLCSVVLWKLSEPNLWEPRGHRVHQNSFSPFLPSFFICAASLLVFISTRLYQCTSLPLQPRFIILSFFVIPHFFCYSVLSLNYLIVLPTFCFPIELHFSRTKIKTKQKNSIKTAYYFSLVFLHTIFT